MSSIIQDTRKDFLNPNSYTQMFLGLRIMVSALLKSSLLVQSTITRELFPNMTSRLLPLQKISSERRVHGHKLDKHPEKCLLHLHQMW